MEKIGLPKELAIKIVKGDGKRVIAVFADPNCHYCQQFEDGLRQVDNITIYVFPYNILSVDSMYLITRDLVLSRSCKSMGRLDGRKKATTCSQARLRFSQR